MGSTAEEAKTNSCMTFFYELLQMDRQVLADQQRLTYISSVQTQDAARSNGW